MQDVRPAYVYTRRVIREVLRTDPRLGAEPRGFAWWLSILVCKPILLVLRRPDWRGVEYVPRAGGAVLAANHVSHIDPLLVAEMILAQRRVPRFLAKDSLFAVPLVGWWFRSAGHVEVDRSAGQAGYRSAVEAVARGQLILVYPEGSITKREDGLPMAMKSGAVRIALAASVPLLPVAQWGAQEILPSYSGRLRLGWRRPVSLVVGPPVPLDDLHELGETWAVKEGCRRMEAAITAMVDQLAVVPADR
jgi:1-acyl-sn-glycerol-3-phosphate acyltransferase